MGYASSNGLRWIHLSVWLSGAFAVTALVVLLTALSPRLAEAADSRVAAPVDGGMVDAIRRRGILRCGIGAISEYAWRDDTGRMEGFRVDLCRAVAAAVLDARDAVEFVRPIAAHRLEMLVNGDVDLLIAGVSWTLTREAKAGCRLPRPSFTTGRVSSSGDRSGWSRWRI